MDKSQDRFIAIPVTKRKSIVIDRCDEGRKTSHVTGPMDNEDAEFVCLTLDIQLAQMKTIERLEAEVARLKKGGRR